MVTCCIVTSQCSFDELAGRKEMFYLTMHATHVASDMVNDHSNSERRNPLPPLHRLLFPISSKGSFICTIPQTE